MFRKVVLIIAAVTLIGVGSQCHAQGRKWAVIIGIGKYANVGPELSAAREALQVKQRLLECGGMVERSSNEKISADASQGCLLCLIDENATKENIKTVLTDWLPKYLRPDDSLFFYFGGHGCSNDLDRPDLVTYIVPHDAKGSKNPPGIDPASGISDQEFGQWIDHLNCRLVTAVFDSCYSGGAAQTRSVGPRSRRLLSQDFTREIKRKGAFVVCACQSYETAWDGVFTPDLLKVFRKDRANISDGDLLENLKRLVSSDKNRGGDQTPMIIDHAPNEPRPLSEFFCSGTPPPVQREAPQISITLVPSYDEVGGRNTHEDIAGRVSGVDDPTALRVVLYAFTETYWYIQPELSEPFTRLDDGGKWGTWTHTGMKYAALLVKPTFRLPRDSNGSPRNLVTSLPNLGGDVLALVVEPGKKPEKE